MRTVWWFWTLVPLPIYYVLSGRNITKISRNVRALIGLRPIQLPRVLSLVVVALEDRATLLIFLWELWVIEGS